MDGKVDYYISIRYFVSCNKQRQMSVPILLLRLAVQEPLSSQYDIPSQPIQYPQPTNTISPANQYNIPSQPIRYPQPTNTISPASQYDIPSQPIQYPQPTNTISPANQYNIPSQPIRYPQPTNTISFKRHISRVSECIPACFLSSNTLFQVKKKKRFPHVAIFTCGNLEWMSSKKELL